MCHGPLRSTPPMMALGGMAWPSTYTYAKHKSIRREKVLGEQHPRDRRRESVSLVFGGLCLCIRSPLQKGLVGLLNRGGYFKGL